MRAKDKLCAILTKTICGMCETLEPHKVAIAIMQDIESGFAIHTYPYRHQQIGVR